MRYLVQDIFGDEVAELMGDYWGLDREGELKGAFKPCGREFSASFLLHALLKRGEGEKGNRERGDFLFADNMTGPAMWYHGGTIGQARYYSRFLALQIKAKLLGMPLSLYEETP